MKSFSRFLFLAINMISITNIFTNNGLNEEKLKELMDEIRNMLLLMPREALHEIAITREFRNIIQDILNTAHKNDQSDHLADKESNKELSENRFFEPKQPTPLTDTEKKINILDRIAKKYIGDLPSQVRDLVFYFNNHEKCVKVEL